jgi:uncharacterized protein
MHPLKRLLRRIPLALLFVPLLGCEAEAEPAVLPPRIIATVPGTDPLAAIPRDELYGASPVENLWTPRVELEVLNLPRGWQGVRIAVLSDFNLGLWEGNEAVAEAAIRRAVEAQPDIIALLGDYVANIEAIPALERLLPALQGQQVVAVLGDRDIRTDSIEAGVVRALEGAGVRLLRNNSTSMVIRGDTAWISGIDPDLVTRTFADQQYVIAILGEPGRTPLLLTHLPALTSRAPEGRFPVMLGGGTFCGPVEVPGTPRVSWLRNEALPNAYIEGTERLFRLRGGTLVITCGLGYGFVPIRFGAPPEVLIVTLVGVGMRAADVPQAGEVPDTLIQRFQGAPREPGDTL